jgi:hypothetical protein
MQVWNTANPNGAVNVTVESCYIHDLSFFSPWPSAPDNQTHNDCVQIEGGSNIRFTGNNFTGLVSSTVGTPNLAPPGKQANAAFMIKPDVGQIANINISNNWLGGGAFTININNDLDANHTVMLGNIGRINYNKFGRNQRIQGPGGDMTYTISMPSNVVCETIGNVYEDNGHPIYVRHNG